MPAFSRALGGLATLLALAPSPRTASAQRTVASLNDGWKFQMNGGGGGGKAQDCKDLTKTFPTDYSGRQCSGLKQAAGVKDLAGCAAACCAESACEIYQFCPGGGEKCGAQSCWIGQLGGAGGPGACQKQAGWESRGRQGAGPPTPGGGGGGGPCKDPRCMPSTDDSGWRTVTIPHDFVVEGNFSKVFDEGDAALGSSVDVETGERMQTTDPKVHGYLPFGIAWYRKHFTPPAELKDAPTQYIDFDGIQTTSEVQRARSRHLLILPPSICNHEMVLLVD
eukprot:SAG22_NODE_835_length_6917_cov_8.098709_1_plen_279_part_00